MTNRLDYLNELHRSHDGPDWRTVWAAFNKPRHLSMEERHRRAVTCRQINWELVRAAWQDIPKSKRLSDRNERKYRSARFVQNVRIWQAAVREERELRESMG